MNRPPIPVLVLLGWMLVALAAAMLLPAIISAAYSENSLAVIFAISGALTVFAGGGMLLSSRGAGAIQGRMRDMVLITVMWTVIPAFGALPFFGANLTGSFSGAYFEAVSGFTTTGATLIRDIDAIPRGIVFWRACLQWLGGGATLVTVGLMIKPTGPGSYQDMRYLFPEAGRSHLRMLQTVKDYLPIYTGLTLACFIMLLFAGTPQFDAICLSLSVLPTGGFMPRNGALDSYGASAGVVIWLFMIIGATSFYAHRALFHRRGISLHRNNLETGYVILLCLAGGVVSGLANYLRDFQGAHENLIGTVMEHIFTVSSLVTTTGFHYSENSMNLLPFMAVMMLCAIGGASYSTAGGIKLVRIVLLIKLSGRELLQLVHPHSINLIRFDRTSSEAKQFKLVWVFFSVFLLVLAFCVLAVSVSGVGFEQSLLASISALSNTGPAFERVGGSYADLPAIARTPLIIAMILGRVEFLAVIGMINIAFWRD